MVMSKTDSEWKKKLAAKRYKILRKKSTEIPFTGKLLHEKGEGVYVCGGCGAELFSSDTKYDSGSGWPSFYDVLSRGRVKLKKDKSLFGERVEAVCAKCGGHLGHLFTDGPKPTGKRYCINSGALEFKKKGK